MTSPLVPDKLSITPRDYFLMAKKSRAEEFMYFSISIIRYCYTVIYLNYLSSTKQNKYKIEKKIYKNINV